MIIDKICDRLDDIENGEYNYKAKQFYGDVQDYGEIGFSITYAMDYGTETEVKKALCEYVERNGYSENIKTFINSVNWLTDDEEDARC